MAALDAQKLLDCALCPNMCRFACPTAEATGREAAAPAGKARLAYLLQENRLQPDQSLLQALHTCLGCDACTRWCPFEGMDLPGLLRDVRQNLGDRDVFFHPARQVLASLAKGGSPYVVTNAHKFENLGNKEAPLLYFVGCAFAEKRPGAVQATLALLQKAGVPYQTMEEVCCGFPAKACGSRLLHDALIRQNLRFIKESGAKTLLTGCPACYEAFRTSYPALGMGADIEVVTTASFFLRLLQDKKLTPKINPSLPPLAYHHPCYTARKMPDAEGSAPLDVLALLPGLRVSEPLDTGRDTICCGGGEMLARLLPDTSLSLAKKRLKALLDPGAQAVVTSCPFCLENLQRAGGAVFDLSEVLAETCLD
jgi:fumarate reductase (CoM/CoB) subunit B